jgi:hypothetical protein
MDQKKIVADYLHKHYKMEFQVRKLMSGRGFKDRSIDLTQRNGGKLPP